MKIARMTKGEWGKIRAFFDLQTSDGLIVKGFKLIESDGLFVGYPSVKKDEKYENTAYAVSKEVGQTLNKLAHDHFHGTLTEDSPPQRQSGGMSEVARIQDSTDYADKDEVIPF